MTDINVNDAQKTKYIIANEARKINLGGRPRAFDSPESLKAACQEYIDNTQERKAPLTMAGLAAYLGRGRMTIIDYASGKYDTKEEKYSCAIKELRSIIEQDKIDKALLGSYNPTIAIFDLKNNHDYKDRVDHTSDDKPITTQVTLKISDDCIY